MPKSDFIETQGTVIRMRGHGFYTVALANGHEVLARMSGRMTKNHIRVIQDDRVLLEISPADWSQGRIVYRYKGFGIRLLNSRCGPLAGPAGPSWPRRPSCPPARN